MIENKVDVQINGINYTLITDGSEEHIKEIAAYVERKINEARSEKLGYNKELVLACLNIADDLYSVGHKYQALREESSEAVENYPGLVDKYQKAVEQNEDLIAKIEEIIEANKNLEGANSELNQRLKAAQTSDESEEKLQNEIKRLQQEVMTLKAENDQLKENI